jgi:hypothetical protein
MLLGMYLLKRISCTMFLTKTKSLKGALTLMTKHISRINHPTTGMKMSCQKKLEEHNARRRVGTSSHVKRSDSGTKPDLPLNRSSLPDFPKILQGTEADQHGAGYLSTTVPGGPPPNLSDQGTGIGTAHLLAAFESLASHLGIPVSGVNSSEVFRRAIEVQSHLGGSPSTRNDNTSGRPPIGETPNYYGPSNMQPSRGTASNQHDLTAKQPTHDTHGYGQPSRLNVGMHPTLVHRGTSTGRDYPSASGNRVGNTSSSMPIEIRSLAQLVASAVSNSNRNPLVRSGFPVDTMPITAQDQLAQTNIPSLQGDDWNAPGTVDLTPRPKDGFTPKDGLTVKDGFTPKDGLTVKDGFTPKDGLTVRDGRASTNHYQSDSYVTRLSVKLFDCKPEDLEPSLRTEVEGLMEVPSSLLETYLRAGCAHATLEFHCGRQMCQSGGNGLSSESGVIRFGMKVATVLSLKVLHEQLQSIFTTTSGSKFFLVQVDNIVAIGCTAINCGFSTLPAPTCTNKYEEPVIVDTSSSRQISCSDGFNTVLTEKTNLNAFSSAMVFDGRLLPGGLPKFLCIDPCTVASPSMPCDDTFVKITLAGTNMHGFGVAYFCRQRGKYIPVDWERDDDCMQHTMALPTSIESVFLPNTTCCVTLVIPASSLCLGCAEIEVEQELLVGESSPLLVLPNTSEGVEAMKEINIWVRRLVHSQDVALIKNSHCFLRDIGRLLSYDPAKELKEFSMETIASNALNFAKRQGWCGVVSLLQPFTHRVLLKI